MAGNWKEMLNNIKDQLSLYKKQTAVLVTLVLVLGVVLTVQFAGKPKQASAAVSIPITALTSPAPAVQAGIVQPPANALEKEVFVYWSELSTDLKRQNPFDIPWPVPIDDGDGDGVNDADDNCPMVPNSGQQDSNHDGIGDACSQGDSTKPAKDGRARAIGKLKLKGVMFTPNEKGCSALINNGVKDRCFKVGEMIRVRLDNSLYKFELIKIDEGAVKIKDNRGILTLRIPRP